MQAAFEVRDTAIVRRARGGERRAIYYTGDVDQHQDLLVGGGMHPTAQVLEVG